MAKLDQKVFPQEAVYFEDELMKEPTLLDICLLPDSARGF